MPSVNRPLKEDAKIMATTHDTQFMVPSRLPGGVMGESIATMPAGTYVVQRSILPSGSGTYEVLENRHMRAQLYLHQVRELTPIEALSTAAE